MKQQHPLVRDIYKVLTDGATVTDQAAFEFGSSLATIISNRLDPANNNRAFTLRMSNVGKGARELWYAKRYDKEEPLEGHTLLKFLIGDIVEHTLLFLAEASGHKVTARQEEVEIGGVKGHIDSDIDRVTVDVKSASPFAFKKFQDGTLPDNDAFGYMEQISAYGTARGTPGAFLAMDKVSGHLAYLEYSPEELAEYDVTGRIEYLKLALESPTEPERCHQDEKMGESGNRKLGTNCSYCDFKKRCWADANGGLGLRTFLYANGPVFLTEVKVEPKVFEKVSF